MLAQILPYLLSLFCFVFIVAILQFKVVTVVQHHKTYVQTPASVASLAKKFGARVCIISTSVKVIV